MKNRNKKANDLTEMFMWGQLVGQTNRGVQDISLLKQWWYSWITFKWPQLAEYCII